MSNIFENTLDNNKFKYTNIPWNTGLNSPWMVGYISRLINSKKFDTKEEWKDFYFNSGEERKKILSEYDSFDVQGFYRKNGDKLIPNNMKYINYDFGRTKKELVELGEELYEEVLKMGNTVNLTKKECMYAVYYRVVCETWNGIKGREFNTCNKILEFYNSKGMEVELVKTNSRFDADYAVDYEVYYDGFILCGIQIKPISYLKMKTNYNKFKEINIRKNNLYLKKYKRDVYYIYSDVNGNFDIKELDDITYKLKVIKSA